MDQFTTRETVALSAPVLEALRQLDAAMKMRKRQTKVRQRIALARSRAQAALQAKEEQ